MSNIETVQDLIDELQKVENKKAPIKIWIDGDIEDICMIDEDIRDCITNETTEVHINCKEHC